MAALFKRGPRPGPITPFKMWPKVSTVATFKTQPKTDTLKKIYQSRDERWGDGKEYE